MLPPPRSGQSDSTSADEVHLVQPRERRGLGVEQPDAVRAGARRERLRFDPAVDVPTSSAIGRGRSS